MVNCWVARKPGGFGFVEMQSRNEAKRAVRKLHGSFVHGFKVRNLTEKKTSKDKSILFVFQIKVEMSQDKAVERSPKEILPRERSPRLPFAYRKRNSISSSCSKSDYSSEDDYNKVNQKKL